MIGKKIKYIGRRPRHMFRKKRRIRKIEWQEPNSEFYFISTIDSHTGFFISRFELMNGDWVII